MDSISVFHDTTFMGDTTCVNVKNVNAVHVIAMRINDHDKSLFGGGGSANENRKLLNFWARFIITLANAITFLVLIGLLFFVEEVSESNSSLVNIMIGMYVAVQVKIIDYWFREKKDAEHDEDMNGRK